MQKFCDCEMIEFGKLFRAHVAPNFYLISGSRKSSCPAAAAAERQADARRRPRPTSPPREAAVVAPAVTPTAIPRRPHLRDYADSSSSGSRRPVRRPAGMSFKFLFYFL